MADPLLSDIRNLARFRHALRAFQRLSEQVVRKVGLTPQQHQLLLGVAGANDRGAATITQLAEFLQVKHHSAVGLVDRAEAARLVRRDANPDNHREVLVTLTADGTRKLRALADLHRRELAGMRRSLDLFRLERDSAAAKAAQRGSR